ncbi:MAG: hypothetical protein U5R06_08200 [candidate division KSB1 bacterium]|nr:hypothetical protein [candidate division KSB1 bacterium]
MKPGFIFITFVVISAACLSHAQYPARGVGMGNAYSAIARGVHAADSNPANLGLPDNPRYMLTLLGAGMHLSNNTFTQAMYNKYNGSVLDVGDVEQILNSIPEDGFKADFGGHVRTLCLSYNNIAITLGGQFGGYVNIDKELFDLALTGNERNRRYSLDKTDGKLFGMGHVRISYGHSVPVDFAKAFSLGASLNLFTTQYYTSVNRADLQLVTRDFGFDLDGEYSVIHSQSTGSWDITVGAAAVLKDDLQLSMTIKHLSSRFKWDKHTKEIQGYMRGDSLAVLDFQDTDQQDIIQDSTWKSSTPAFTTRLPLELNVSAAKQIGNFLLAAEYNQAFKKDVFVSPVPRISFGAEWQRVPYIPLRMGLLLGGQMKHGLSLGLGIQLGSFTWDLGLMNRGFFLPSTNKGLIISTEFGLYF